jgi:hypothetical protein
MFWNHMWIYIWVSIRGQGWCVSRRTVEVKNFVGLSFRSLSIDFFLD